MTSRLYSGYGVGPRCFVAGVLACLVAASVRPVWAESDGSRLLDVLREGYEQVRDTRGEVRIVYETMSVVHGDVVSTLGVAEPREDQETSPSVFRSRSRYVSRDGRERVDTGLSEDVPGALAVFDGQYLLTFHSTKGTPDTETQVGRAVRAPHKEGLLESGHGPVRLYGYAGMMPEDVLGSPEAVANAEPYEINGVTAHKVTSPIAYKGITYQVSYWFSAERSGLPVRFEVHDPQERFYKRLDVEQFVRLPDGNWFPKQTVFSRPLKNAA